MPSALLLIIPKLENTGPVILLVYFLLLLIEIFFAFLAQKIADRLNWYAPENKLGDTPRFVFGIICGIVTALLVTISVGKLWLKGDLGGPWTGGSFTGISIFQGLLIFLTIRKKQKLF
jgi:hypothetical protein